jgi:excisionase family DNA binding protein
MPTATAPPDSTPSPLLLTSRDAARSLAVSERTLWGLTYPRGPIRAVRFGRAVRYSADTLRAWVRSQEGGGQQ